MELQGGSEGASKNSEGELKRLQSGTACGSVGFKLAQNGDSRRLQSGSEGFPKGRGGIKLKDQEI